MMRTDEKLWEALYRGKLGNVLQNICIGFTVCLTHQNSKVHLEVIYEHAKNIKKMIFYI